MVFRNYGPHPLNCVPYISRPDDRTDDVTRSKAAHEGLSKSEARGPQHNEAVLLAKYLLAQPAMWDNPFRRITASMIIDHVHCIWNSAYCL